ncbi:MAG TPA: phosphoribosylformylglycinamidine synthase I [Patescibacteria group bacterium]|nr:phosphoribosylformylglycinamidine synthase I [Patescibacteria group bacterium]
MKREEIKVLLMRAPGTNCDAETVRAFEDTGVDVSLIHTQKIFREKNLLDYDVVVFPGGFSYGDYVRSGSIWAKEMEYRIGTELEKFVNEGRPVIGICNGFQLLVEAGFLPGFEGRSIYPEAALANSIRGYQCRWIRMKYVNGGRCRMMSKLPEDYLMRVPIAHGEGRFVYPQEDEKFLERLQDNDQLVFKYAREDGSPANMELWYNPNGAWHDIAGICNPEGNVLGLMPHPERAYFGYLMPQWSRDEGHPEYGDGKVFFESIISYVEKKI